MDRIPVFAGGLAIDHVDAARARQLAKGRNIQAVRRRKDGKIVRLNLTNFGGSDEGLQWVRGNPRRYSHDHETERNPPRVWTLRHLPSFTGPIFRRVLTDCIARKAA